MPKREVLRLRDELSRTRDLKKRKKLMDRITELAKFSPGEIERAE